MTSWSRLLERAEPLEHLVHLYGSNDDLLIRHISRYASAGLTRGDAVVIIATPPHAGGVVDRLSEEGIDLPAAIGERRLAVLDAGATLERILVHGTPSRPRFDTVIGGLLDELEAQAASGRVRAFGEMVGLLWARGNLEAAVRLEEFWYRLLMIHGISLLCAYPIDILCDQVDAASLHALMGAHTHILAAPHTLFGGRPRSDGSMAGVVDQ